ncbi:uncharacterized protein LOC143082559 [Mytilus galloprovincialis]|uniref:uncharacterized protein LOC143082559 n=1 Tax=Mytilus galloprovincialis TaxID=29158 RepID=UPI003F7C1EAC
MPGVTVRTNIKEMDLRDDFEEKIAEKASEVLKAPLELIYISVSPGNRMLNNGRKTPMIFVDISAIFKDNVYDDFNKIFIPFFASLLDLPLNRVVIKYINVCPTDFGMVREAPEFKHAEFYSSLKQ